jgi:hypothetical protein
MLDRSYLNYHTVNITIGKENESDTRDLRKAVRCDHWVAVYFHVESPAIQRKNQELVTSSVQ